MSRPRSTKDNVVFSVKEVGGVTRIERHSLEALVSFQSGAGPLPQASHASLPSQLVAVLGDGHWVPVFETHICVSNIDEKVMRVQGCSTGGAGLGSPGWW